MEFETEAKEALRQVYEYIDLREEELGFRCELDGKGYSGGPHVVVYFEGWGNISVFPVRGGIDIYDEKFFFRPWGKRKSWHGEDVKLPNSGK